MVLLRKLSRPMQERFFLTQEEAVLVMNALRRSQEAMPDQTETVMTRERRADREARLHADIKRRI